MFSEFQFFSLQEEAFYYGINVDFTQLFETQRCNNDVVETGGIEGVLVSVLHILLQQSR